MRKQKHGKWEIKQYKIKKIKNMRKIKNETWEITQSNKTIKNGKWELNQ